jgi:hypothetical protein
LPKEIKRILVNNFKDLVVTDFNEIFRLDTLDIPNGTELHSEEANGKIGHKISIKEPNDENGFNNMQDMEMVGDDEEEDDIQPDYEQEENLDPSENSGSSALEKAGSSSQQEKPVNIPPESGTHPPHPLPQPLDQHKI